MNLPDQLHFIRPLWLLALPLAVLLPWAFAHVRRPSGDWERVCDPHLLRWLSVRQGGTGSRSGAWLAGAGLAIAVLALSGPSWQKLPESTLSARAARVIAFDLSASMLAEDLRPNRLTRARFRVADLLSAMEEGQTGLVAFAGDAYKGQDIREVPKTLRAALECLDGSKALRAAFGDAVVEHYLHCGRWEQFEYDRRVTDHELIRGFERA